MCWSFMSWRIHLSKSGESLYVVYKFVKDHDHTSSTDFTMKRKISKKLIGEIFYEKVCDSPEYKPTQMVKDFKQDYDIHLSYMQAWRGKEIARELIHGKVDGTFVRLPWYCNRIMESNPGSEAFVEKGISNRFRRCFISFQASLDGFRRDCQRMLFIDGTHLKARFKGTLLSACGPDANNGLFPVAFAVVAGETLDDWEWFLRNLKRVLAMDVDIVIVSDRHPNIISTVAQVFKAELHAYCFHHIEVNVLDHIRAERLPGKDKDLLIQWIWRLAFTGLHVDYNRCLEKIMKISPGAHACLLSFEPQHWATCKFPVRRYGMLTSNHAESYNNWIKEAREMPILYLVDTIRKKIMTRYHLEAKRKWKTNVGDIIDMRLKKLYTLSEKFSHVQSNRHTFEVCGDEMLNHTVDTVEMKCSCLEWYFSGLPCSHACNVLKKFKRDPSLFVDVCYSRAKQDSIYKDNIKPMESWDMPSIFPDPFLEPCADILPPIVRRGPGRPTKTRIESQLRPYIRVLRCSICGEAGHNHKTCRHRYGVPA